MPLRKSQSAESSAWKLIAWTAFVGLLFGLLQLGEIAEDFLRTARNNLHTHSASGDIVVVGIDEDSLRQVGRWPWPRRQHGQLIDKVSAGGAKEIYLDIQVDTRGDPADDAAFAAALRRSGKVTVPVFSRSGPGTEQKAGSLRTNPFLRDARLGSVSLFYNYQNAAWHLPFATRWDGQDVPTFSALMGGKASRSGEAYMLDYSIDPKSVPFVSAGDLLTGKIGLGQFAGKKVIIGAAAEILGDQYFIPGTGKMPGAYVHTIGAETLKRGTPVELGWLLPYLAALAIAAFVALRRIERPRSVIFGAATALFLLAPALLEMNLIFVEVVPALAVTSIVWGILARRSFRTGGLTNAVSGLPNLNALRNNRAGRTQALIAARVLNYDEIAAALPAGQERQLIEQIVSRLRVGSPERVLYQGDGGIFAWFENSEQPVSNHVEALHVLFRNPARVDGLPIDLSVSFGVELGSSRTLSNRLASALVAADEAAHDGLKWKYHDPETLEDASWKLSMLSQLDDAVDKGEVWVAYQPKLDLQTRRIVGAEALARWTHPEKGPIAASEFIAAAEQHDRIGKLTDFVLESAIKSAAALNRKEPGFGMAVNLSARLLGDKGFVLRLRAMLARHGLAAHLLTLELTETAALAGNGSAFDMLAALRELGVTIAIDDYGTGLSTLDYLKKIPASEIKIDQSFVKGMLDNRSDLVMVQSTIALAHSLERKVVAEGVEDQTVLDALVDMKCDVAQGYVIGRPMSLESLTKRLAGSRRSSVA